MAEEPRKLWTIFPKKARSGSSVSKMEKKRQRRSVTCKKTSYKEENEGNGKWFKLEVMHWIGWAFFHTVPVSHVLVAFTEYKT